MSAKQQGTFTHAMILCAGFGTRMRPLTDTVPKPLIKVAGKHLADYAVAQARKAGIENIIVNAHYLADQIARWAQNHRHAKITVSDETDEILETGGGVGKALDLLGTAPFLVFNSDAFWLDTPGTNSVQNLINAFDEETTDFVLLLADRNHSHGYDGTGDFFRGKNGTLSRRGDKENAPFVYAGCYAVHPRVFTDLPDGPFSMNLLWDRAIAKNRLRGIVIGGVWLHVGTPEAVGLAEHEMANFQKNQK